MNIQTPIEDIQGHILNTQITAQSKKWDVETHLLEFQRALDTLDLISDGLPDDPRVSNALNGLHDSLSKIYVVFEAKLID